MANLKQTDDKNLLVGFKESDDCGIYRLRDNTLLVQSVDFITPVVDDAFMYGQIASANALSDVFAKRARALTAMSLLMWDKEHLEAIDIQAILEGAQAKLDEAKCALVGGHSIVDKEQKYGLSVTGIIEDEIFWRNNSALIGDSIILTKPIGSGILTTALKRGLMEYSSSLEVVQSMASLNLRAKEIAQKFEVSACTDVTGFGLLGHLKEMLNEHISIEVMTNEVLVFDRAIEFLEQEVVPMGSRKNKEFLSPFVQSHFKGNDLIFYDAQTSGGLLIALNEKDAKELLKQLVDNGIQASIIAQCVKKQDIPLKLL